MRSSASTVSEDSAPFLLQVCLESVQGVPGFAARVIVLVLGDVRDACRRSRTCAGRAASGSTKERAGSRYSMLRVAKKSTSFVNAAFTTSGVPATIGHGAPVLRVLHEVLNVREDREEDVVERALPLRLVLVEEQVVNVRLHHLAREAGVDRAVLAPSTKSSSLVWSLKMMLERPSPSVRSKPGRTGPSSTC